MKKFELTTNKRDVFGVTVFQIRALKDFGCVEKGELGGYVQKEGNLSQKGLSWIYDDAVAAGNAKVYGNASVFCNALVCEKAKVYGNALVSDGVQVYGSAEIFDDARVYKDASVHGNAKVYGGAHVLDRADIKGNASVCGFARVRGYSVVQGNAYICGATNATGEEEFSRDAMVYSDLCYATIKGFGMCARHTTFYQCKDGSIGVSCGCFQGTLSQFRERVIETRSGKIAKEYLLIADLMEYHLKKEENDG